MKAYPDSVEISLTKARIANGRKMSAHYCPVALAVKAKFKLDPDSHDCGVANVINIYKDRTSYQMPQELIDWIAGYDYGVESTPQKFMITRIAYAD